MKKYSALVEWIFKNDDGKYIETKLFFRSMIGATRFAKSLNKNYEYENILVRRMY